MKIANAATTLLSLFSYLRKTNNVSQNLSALREQILLELQQFDQKLQSHQYDAHLILAARYCIVAAIDESVLTQAWGTESIWLQQPLLSLLHPETAGGEKFYIILEELAKQPDKNYEILELLYFLLALGFEGKFYNHDPLIRVEIRKRLFERIQPFYAKETPWPSKYSTENKPVNQNSLSLFSRKKLLIASSISLVFMNLFLNHELSKEAEPLIASLEKIGKGSAVLTYQALTKK